MLAVALAWPLAGCRPAQSPPEGPPPAESAGPVEGGDSRGDAASDPAEEAASKIAPDDVSLEVVDEEQLAAVVAGHAGKVVLVDFWALWCPSCVQLFPHTVQLHEKHEEEDLAVLSVSFDDPDTDLDRVRAFLASKGAGFENFVSVYGAGTRSADAFQTPGGLPHFKLYDRDGKLVQSIGLEEGEVTAERIDQALEKLLEP